MRIDKPRAAALVREEAARAVKGKIDPAWAQKVEKLSQLCEEGVSKTHIAFLGTEMLAKAMDRRVDLFAIKPDHAPGNPNAFSARTLCHTVLVPLSAELGISIGVTGREPLNNQPYFRMTRLGDDTPVHAGGRAAFTFMVELVKELQKLKTEDEARAALRAFIAVRRRYQPRYLTREGEAKITPEQLIAAIKAFVGEARRAASARRPSRRNSWTCSPGWSAWRAVASMTRAASIQATCACARRPIRTNGRRPSRFATSRSRLPMCKSSLGNAAACMCRKRRS